MQLPDLLPRLARAHNQHDTLAACYSDLQQQNPTPHQALLALGALQSIDTGMTAAAAERLPATKVALQQAVAALDSWQAIATSVAFWQQFPSINANDRWAMYVGMEATTEVLAQHEAQLTRRRAQAHEDDDALPFDLAQNLLLARVRVLRACGEAILACWQWQPRCAHAYLGSALAEVVVWQELMHEAAEY